MNKEQKEELKNLIKIIEDGQYPRYIVDFAIMFADSFNKESMREEMWSFSEELYEKYDKTTNKKTY